MADPTAKDLGDVTGIKPPVTKKTTKKTTKTTTKRVNWDKTKVAKAIDNLLYVLIRRTTCNHTDDEEGHYTAQEFMDIRLGGAILGVITFYVPTFNPDHPIMVLILRVINMVLLIKQKCLDIKQKFGIQE